MLLRDNQSSLAKLVQQGIFIDFLKEPSPQRVQHREGATYYPIGKEVDPVHVARI
jgi:hypothetical protein